MTSIKLKCKNINVSLDLPEGTDIRVLAEAPVLTDTSAAVTDSLEAPIASEPLDELARGCRSASVVVSDNTRPVPYKGPNGILTPIIETLKNSELEWHRKMYLEDLGKIVNYGGDKRPRVRHIQKWETGTDSILAEGVVEAIDIASVDPEKVWVWSDLHFGHKNIIEFSERHILSDIGNV